MSPEPTLWPLGVHTPGKHIVLRWYLNAWLPIMGMKGGRLVVIDGFAGPGKYEGGEPGSPVITLSALINHAAKDRITAQVNYLFVEEDGDRANHLSTVIEPLKSQLPNNSQVVVHNGSFDGTLNQLLDSAGATGGNLAPAFVIVDPFGVSGVPMAVLARILANPKSELYISFMYEAINRFKVAQEFEPHLDALFGIPDWRNGIDIEDSDERKAFFYDLFTAQLKNAGAKCVVNFELYEGGRHVYTIFFATQHHLGCDRMKGAIWKIAPSGDFAFRGSRVGQLSLLDDLTADTRLLQNELRLCFGNGEVVSIEELKDWVASDETDFYSGQLKKALKEMESRGEVHVEVPEGERRRAGTFRDGTRLKIAPLAI